MRLRKLLVPIVGGLLASVAVAGSASASTGSEPPDPPGREAIVEARGEWADCLREQGVDVPEDGPFVFEEGDAEALRAATEACAEELGEPGDRHFVLPFPAERMEELRGKMEGFHDCLREQGVDVPEPAELPAPPRVSDDDEVVFHEDGPHHRFDGHPFGELDDAEVKELRQAAEACGAELPDEFPHDAPPFFHHAA